jgi:hypothetical protein
MHRDPKDANTYHFGEELTKNPDELIVHQLTALDTWVFQTLNLLLHDNFESRCANEERWRRTLR